MIEYPVENYTFENKFICSLMNRQRRMSLTMKKHLLISFLLICFFSAQAQIREKDELKLKGLSAITEDAVKGQLEFLASDWTEGRETGTKGSFMAADYIASMLKVYGIVPIGDYERPGPKQNVITNPLKRTFFQDFSLIESQQGDSQQFSVSFTDGTGIRKIDLNYRTDFYCGTTEAGIDLSAPVVFIGYGIIDESKGINELKGLNVKGKIVLRLVGTPGMNFPNSEGMKKFGTEIVLKDELLLKNGALAIMDVATDDDLQSWAENYPFHFKSAFYEGDSMPEFLKSKRMRIPLDTLSTNLKRILISKRVANEILRESGITVDGYATDASGLKFPRLKNLTGINAHIAMSVKNRVVKARNIIGIIEGEIKDEYVVVGGHYDHVGIQNGLIFNGADDNASGTVGIMTLAKAFMATGVKPKRTILFALWTGEEKGLLGSDYFVENSAFKDKKIVFYLNYDMISRSAPEDTIGKTVKIVYPKSYPAFEEITKNNMKANDIDLTPNFVPMDIPRGGSDYTAFCLKNVPLMAWNAGHPAEYHKPNDEVSLVNWAKMINIIKLGFLDVWDITNGNILREK